MTVRPWPEVVDALPKLSATQKDEMRRSIENIGVKYPVKVMADGRIIDGHHRWELSGETARCEVEDVDEEAGFAMALALNLCRRHLSTEQIVNVRDVLKRRKEVLKRVVVAMTEQGHPQREIAAVTGYSQQRVSEIKQEAIRSSTASGTATNPDGNARRRRIPIEDVDAIRQRSRDGEHPTSIAASYNVNESAIRQYLKRADARDELPPGLGGHRCFSDAKEEEIEARYRAGDSAPTLAFEYQCTKSTINNLINRVRSRWDEGRPPNPTTRDVPPDNVIEFGKARGTAQRPPGPPREPVAPEVIQSHAVKWLKEATSIRERLEAFPRRFGGDAALVAALATSAEGKKMGRDLETLATACLSFASTYCQRSNVGEETRTHDSKHG